jgi:hypothetical protein
MCAGDAFSGTIATRCDAKKGLAPSLSESRSGLVGLVSGEPGVAAGATRKAGDSASWLTVRPAAEGMLREGRASAESMGAGPFL